MTKPISYSIKSLPGRSGHRVSSAGEVFYERQGDSDELIPMTPQYRDGTAYLQIAMNGRPRNYSIAYLICLAFHGARPTPRHVPVRANGRIEDNSTENLRWGTRSEMVLACRRANRQAIDISERQPDERPIPGTVSGYYVTPNSTVTSYRFGRRHVLTQRPLHGYMSVQIERVEGRFQPTYVGPLVLAAHDRPRRGSEICRYRDGNRQNHTLANVYWSTRKQPKDTSKDLEATGSKDLEQSTQENTHAATRADAHEATQAAPEPLCRTLSAADADHPAKRHRRAGGLGEGVGVDFLRKAPSDLTGPPPFSRARELMQGGVNQ